MKKLILISLVILLVSGVLLAGCKAPAPSPAPTQAPSPSPASATASAPAVKPIDLSFNIYHPPVAWSVKEEWAPWCKRVEEACNGRVKITVFAGGTLSPAAEAYASAAKGGSDFAWGTFQYLYGQFPMMTVFDLPGMVGSFLSGNHVIYDLYQKYPQFKAEHKDVIPIWLNVVPEQSLFLRDKPIRTLEDLKGIRLRAGAEAIPFQKSWGAAPMAMSLQEAYSALEKGVIDGITLGSAAVFQFRLQEVTKYMTLCPGTGSSLFLVMNQKKLNSLPPDIQKIILEEGKRKQLEWDATIDRQTVAYTKQFAAMPGHEVIQLSKEERARWLEKAQPVVNEWVADMKAKGLPGRELLDDALQLAKKYDAMYPLPPQ